VVVGGGDGNATDGGGILAVMNPTNVSPTPLRWNFVRVSRANIRVRGAPSFRQG
jgi:hypothetical protein